MSEDSTVESLAEIAVEFWKDFSTSWETLQANRWAEFGSADGGFFNAMDGFRELACQLNALIRSLSDDLSNYPVASRNSVFAALASFVHDLSAPLAYMCSFSELSVLNSLKTEKYFLQWRDLMLQELVKVDCVVSGNTAFFTQQQKAA